MPFEDPRSQAFSATETVQRCLARFYRDILPVGKSITQLIFLNLYLTAILYGGLRNDFFSLCPFAFSDSYLDFYFTFFLGLLFTSFFI